MTPDQADAILISWDAILEWAALILNLGFLYFAIREKVLAWPLGVLASIIVAYLFFSTQVYLEGIIYVFYVLAGVYGWVTWANDLKKEDSEDKTGIVVWNKTRHLTWIGIGFLVTYLTGFLFDRFTDEKYPYLDAFSTVFQFLATYLEAKKVLSAWIYWIILNVFGIWFYYRLGFETLSIQMVVFSIFSVVGYLNWRKRYRDLKHQH